MTVTDPDTIRPLVLVVDDDADTREMYETMLGFFGLRVVQAARAEEAIAQARALPPDVLMTDFGLPGLDGCQLCERLKSDPLTSSIPVIMLTGWSSADYLDRMHRAGCDSVLLKPCLPEVLLGEILRQLDRRRSARTHQS